MKSVQRENKKEEFAVQKVKHKESGKKQQTKQTFIKAY